MPSPLPTHALNEFPQGEWPVPGFYRKNSSRILLAILLFSPVYLTTSAIVLTPGDMSAYILDVAHWLPQDNLLIKDMEKFSDVAGQQRSEVVRISWPGCRQADPRLEPFAERIRGIRWNEDLRAANGSESDFVFTEVITIDQLVAKMRGSDAQLSEKQIYGQLQNVMIGEDGTTCLLAMLETRHPPSRAFAISKINEMADQIATLGRENLRMFGGPVYTKQVDASGIRLGLIFTPLSALISLFCAWICLRRWGLLFALFLNAVVCTSAALVTLFVMGVEMDPLLMLLPGFWFVMSMSSSIHFLNYYLDVTADADEHSTTDLSAATVAIARRPTSLATLTTCVGLSALCVTEILPLYRFGLHASIGLIASFITSYLFLPSWLQWTSGRTSKPAASLDRVEPGFWGSYAELAQRFGLKTAVLFLLLLVVAGIGFSRLSFSNKLSDQFPSQSRINTDAAWFESEIGPTIPFEVLVRFPKTTLPRPSQCLGYIAALQGRIESFGLPCKTISATSVVPYSSGTGGRQAVRRAIMDKRIQRHRPGLAETGFVIDEPKAELWRISVFTYNSRDVTMQEYLTQIRLAIEEQRLAPEYQGQDVQVSYAGLGARMAVITEELGGGLKQSCIVSAALISVIVILALRSFWLGVIAMFPNIFPVWISLGGFGYIHPQLDIGAIMTASIAMGIAVDDTIHFMYWFQKGIRFGHTRVEAVALAIRKCGRAIVTTSLICGLGFFVFFFCEFMPAARFGQLLFTMLAAACIGDLVFLPAILLGIPGRLFLRHDAKKDQPAPD